MMWLVVDDVMSNVWFVGNPNRMANFQMLNFQYCSFIASLSKRFVKKGCLKIKDFVKISGLN